MAFVLGVRQRLEHLGIAPWTADIFGRATSGRLKQARIGYGRIRGGQTLNLDRVLPAVAEVIKIAQRLRPGVFEHVDEGDFAGIERPVGPVGIGNAPADIAGPDFKRWVLVQPRAACSVRCSRSSLMLAGTSMRRSTLGSTSLSVTLRLITAAVIPPV
jgi:hypothetical protein